MKPQMSQITLIFNLFLFLFFMHVSLQNSDTLRGDVEWSGDPPRLSLTVRVSKHPSVVSSTSIPTYYYTPCT